MMSNVSFWSSFRSKVLQEGPTQPLKLFKHGSQSIYSKTKGGVDGTAQARAILRCSTSSLSWEQKMVSQILETLAVNAFTSWRMLRNEKLLTSSSLFVSLNKNRDRLNHTQSFADFIHDAAVELAQRTERVQEGSDTH